MAKKSNVHKGIISHSQFDNDLYHFIAKKADNFSTPPTAEQLKEHMVATVSFQYYNYLNMKDQSAKSFAHYYMYKLYADSHDDFNQTHRLLLDEMIEFDSHDFFATSFIPKHMLNHETFLDMTSENLDEYFSKYGLVYVSIKPQGDGKTRLVIYMDEYSETDAYFESFKELTPERKMKVVSDYLLRYSNEFYHYVNKRDFNVPKFFNGFEPHKVHSKHDVEKLDSALSGTNVFSENPEHAKALSKDSIKASGISDGLDEVREKEMSDKEAAKIAKAEKIAAKEAARQEKFAREQSELQAILDEKLKEHVANIRGVDASEVETDKEGHVDQSNLDKKEVNKLLKEAKKELKVQEKQAKQEEAARIKKEKEEAAAEEAARKQEEAAKKAEEAKNASTTEATSTEESTKTVETKTVETKTVETKTVKEKKQKTVERVSNYNPEEAARNKADIESNLKRINEIREQMSTPTVSGNYTESDILSHAKTKGAIHKFKLKIEDYSRLVGQYLGNETHQFDSWLLFLICKEFNLPKDFDRANSRVEVESKGNKVCFNVHIFKETK